MIRRFWKKLRKIKYKIPLTHKCQTILYYSRKRNMNNQLCYLVDEEDNMLVDDDGNYLTTEGQ